MPQDKQHGDNPDLMKDLPGKELEELEQTLSKSDEASSNE